MLRHVILAGWPESRKECHLLVLDYWNYRDELTFDHGSILKGNKTQSFLALQINWYPIPLIYQKR